MDIIDFRPPFWIFFFATALIIVRSKFFFSCLFWFAVPRYKAATNFVHPPNHITSLLLVSVGFLSLSLSLCSLSRYTSFSLPIFIFPCVLVLLVGLFIQAIWSLLFFSFGSSPKSHISVPPECRVYLFDGIYSVFAFLHQYFVRISVFNFFSVCFCLLKVKKLFIFLTGWSVSLQQATSRRSVFLYLVGLFQLLFWRKD